MEATYMDYLIMINKENYFLKKGGGVFNVQVKTNLKFVLEMIGKTGLARIVLNLNELKHLFL